MPGTLPAPTPRNRARDVEGVFDAEAGKRGRLRPLNAALTTGVYMTGARLMPMPGIACQLLPEST